VGGAGGERRDARGRGDQEEGAAAGGGAAGAGRAVAMEA
jgi:hypothetical protein